MQQARVGTGAAAAGASTIPTAYNQGGGCLLQWSAHCGLSRPRRGYPAQAMMSRTRLRFNLAPHVPMLVSVSEPQIRAAGEQKFLNF